MIISIGSTNEIKISAVRELLTEYMYLKAAVICCVDVASNVSNQPVTLDETIRGAINRAKDAFQNCDLSFGIESGLMNVPHTKSGYMDVCVCAVYDGKEFHLGLSSAWEFPDKRIMIDCSRRA